MPKRLDIKKVLMIGSGPIVIGQAAEFDYAGTQACQALKEEGIEVVLVNSNPATIMTDMEMATRVYLEPLIPEILVKIIEQERPDSLLATLGGQVGLNLAMALAEKGILEKYGVELLGTSLETIRQAEDRELFKTLMSKIEEPIPESIVVDNVEKALLFAEKIGYPVIVRPGYTLGGTGGGVAQTKTELKEIAAKGLNYSLNKQLLIERSVAGWKEIEFEVIRDVSGNCFAVCSMENIDPVGIHTGDSVVVAPTQTLSSREEEMLRESALKIATALGIEGGCNVQYALHPESEQYYVIEVNPRVSRSSALASKATGYPIAKVATKIALGYQLTEIIGAAPKKPVWDYVVVKIPRWPFDKFTTARRTLGSQMKATGEVMALGKTFSAALLKAIHSLEMDFTSLLVPELANLSTEALLNKLKTADDKRIFIVAEAFRRNMTFEQIQELTGIAPFFLKSLAQIITLEKKEWTSKEWLLAKEIGFSDLELARFQGMTPLELRKKRQELGITPAYRLVDIYDYTTPYYYSCYQAENELKPSTKPKVVVLGSGPIRIGQGIEFDYCSVHAILAIKEAGLEAVVINNNPETVSTDPEISHRLYFEPLTLEHVLDVLEVEKPLGVVVQFGGQTAINLAKPLAQLGIPILGTTVANIDQAEDRERFDTLLEEIKVPRPQGNLAHSHHQAKKIAETLGFPVLVRPSYVLGGRAMEIVYSEKELTTYLEEAVRVSPEHPVLVDRYLLGKEVEVDAICDGEQVLIPGIMEHLEKAGVHSGDSIAIYPSQTLKKEIKAKIIDYTQRLALSLQIKGLLNIQFVVQDHDLYVIEVNPRASRTVPFLSKVTGIPMVKIATKVILGQSLKEQGYHDLYPAEKKLTAIKMPVFSFGKLTDVEPSLGPEMKSTGEVMGLADDFSLALYKAFLGAGYQIPQQGELLATIADKDKKEALPLLRSFAHLGFTIWATPGTAAFLQKNNVPVQKVAKLKEGTPHVVDLIRSGRINFVINSLTKGKQPLRDGFQIRRAAVEFNLPCLTSLDTARGLLSVIRLSQDLTVKALQDY
jgi:carbamoyl-phosphate synthase large subunit